MARARTIKPQILEDEKTSSLSHLEWRLFVSLITMADDHGLLRGEPNQILGHAFWDSRESRESLAESLVTLAKRSLIILYVARGQRYIKISRWESHQRVDHPGKPTCPLVTEGVAEENPALEWFSRDSREAFAKHSREDSEGLAPDRIGKERKGEERGGCAALPLALAAVAEINRLTGKKYSTDSAEIMKNCTALAGRKITEADVTRVVAAKFTEWGGDAKMATQVKPSVLLRPSNFMRYLEDVRASEGARPATSAHPVASQPVFTGAREAV